VAQPRSFCRRRWRHEEAVTAGELTEKRPLHLAFVRSIRVFGKEATLTGGAGGTVPELLFEKKELIPAVQRLLVLYLNSAG
jgi:hypothetical protein